MNKDAIKTVSVNKKAYHDYYILETLEAGIELVGTEVKSIRAGNVNLKDCYVSTHNNEMYVYGMHVSPYDHGNIFNKDPLRPRKLLLHRAEILKMHLKCKQDGLTLIPLSVYFKNGLIKVELALAKGKKLYDKREDMAAKSAERDIQRSMQV
ncbi:MAG: SsrA-binding protein SmpB [Clostridia bacterium]|nr:SsrA-binding protein SmpB [Clostridia bacterium]